MIMEYNTPLNPLSIHCETLGTESKSILKTCLEKKPLLRVKSQAPLQSSSHSNKGFSPSLGGCEPEKSTLIFIRHFTRDNLHDGELSDLASDSSRDSSTRIRNQNLRNEIRRNRAINDTSFISERQSIPDENFVVMFRDRGSSYETTHCHGQFPFEEEDDCESMSSLSCDDSSCCYDYDLDF